MLITVVYTVDTLPECMVYIDPLLVRGHSGVRLTSI